MTRRNRRAASTQPEVTNEEETVATTQPSTPPGRRGRRPAPTPVTESQVEETDIPVDEEPAPTPSRGRRPAPKVVEVEEDNAPDPDDVFGDEDESEAVTEEPEVVTPPTRGRRPAPKKAVEEEVTEEKAAPKPRVVAGGGRRPSTEAIAARKAALEREEHGDEEGTEEGGGRSRRMPTRSTNDPSYEEIVRPKAHIKVPETVVIVRNILEDVLGKDINVTKREAADILEGIEDFLTDVAKNQCRLLLFGANFTPRTTKARVHHKTGFQVSEHEQLVLEHSELTWRKLPEEKTRIYGFRILDENGEPTGEFEEYETEIINKAVHLVIENGEYVPTGRIFTF